MLNDGQHGFVGVFVSGVPALRSVAGIIQRVKIAGQPRHGGEHPHADAGLVHHVEHIFEAFILRAYQIAHTVTTLTKVEQGIGGATLAHFVI